MDGWMDGSASLHLIPGACAGDGRVRARTLIRTHHDAAPQRNARDIACRTQADARFTAACLRRINNRPVYRQRCMDMRFEILWPAWFYTFTL